MQRLMLPLLSIAFLLIVGCAKMPLQGDYVKDTPPKIEQGNEYGIVYFLRESSFGGGGISYFIFEDATKIGVLKSGSYFIHQAAPGKHTYWAETESRAAVTIQVEAGQTYYIEGGVGMGIWAGRPELTEITGKVAEKFLPDLTYIRLATPEESEAYKQREAQRTEAAGAML